MTTAPLRLAATAWIVTLTLAGCSHPEREPVDWLLYDGVVHTLDDAGTRATAIALRDDRIVDVGTAELRQRYEAERELALGGRPVLPGFVDSHIHIQGRARRYVDLPELDSIAAIETAVAARAAELGDGEWITGYGWSEDELGERRRPLRADLDRAAPRNPVLLTRAGGHSAVANTLALEAAGLDDDSPDPEGGVLERDETGHLNGVIRERQDVVGRLVPPATSEELRASFVENLRDLFRHGITSIVQAIDSVDGYPIWQSVYEEHRDSLPRASVQVRWRGLERMRGFGLRTGDGNEHLRVGAVKIMVDGGFTGPAAYTSEPYKGQPGYRGKLSIEPEELERIVREAHGEGWQLGIHAIGDEAIRMTVEQIARTLEETPRGDHRHYLNHFTVRPADATIDLMARNGIHVSQQPNFTYTLEGRYVANLDGERLERNNPLRSVVDRGVFMALSSDILPIGPPVGLYAAVTRRGMSGRTFAADEALTIEEALRAYTRGGAFLTREEDLKGTLEPGKLADLIVLDRDPYAIDPEELLDLEVDFTFLGGRLVFDRSAGP